MTFVEYITSLAPEGETALLVQQKPIMRDGAQKTHGDGTLAYTWPAFLPGGRRKIDGAWYLNTGCFMLDRFRDGKPSASSANAAYVLCMMLDDVGTAKAPNTPPLPRQSHREIRSDRGLAHPTLATSHRNDPVHPGHPLRSALLRRRMLPDLQRRRRRLRGSTMRRRHNRHRGDPRQRLDRNLGRHLRRPQCPRLLGRRRFDHKADNTVLHHQRPNHVSADQSSTLGG